MDIDISIYEGDQEKSPLKAIRKKCIDCAGSRGEVRKCESANTCDLHPFRFGKSPFRKKVKLTIEERKAIRKRLADGKQKK
jgi:hypothetical protein